MKIFLVFSLLAVAMTITTATVQFDPRSHDLERPQQSFPQWQPIPQQQPLLQQEPQQSLPQQQPLPQKQQQEEEVFPQQQPLQQQEPKQPFPLQQPQPQQQQPYPLQQPLPQQHLFLQQPPQQQFPQQMPLLQQQQTSPQQEQPLTQQQQPQYPQKPFPQYPQPVTQKPYPQEQPLPQQQPFVEEKQQLNVCKEFLLQQCNPEEKVSLLHSVITFLRPKIMQQNSCQLKRQQCCRQLANIDEQSRCPAIQSIVHAIVMQQQQQQPPLQQQVDRGFFQSQPQQLGQGVPIQPQQQSSQVFVLPQQLAELKLVRSLVIQTLPMLCNVHVRPYCSTITSPFGSMTTGSGGL